MTETYEVLSAVDRHGTPVTVLVQGEAEGDLADYFLSGTEGHRSEGKVTVSGPDAAMYSLAPQYTSDE